MEKQVFKSRVETFLLNDEANKNQNITSVDFDTNLWDNGLVDSFRIMELILFLEDLIGAEISVENNFISNFHTINLMYNSLVKEPV